MIKPLVTVLGHFRAELAGKWGPRTYREFPSDFDLASSADVAPPDDVVAAIGTDERRMHVRAYNHWVSLLDGRDFPSIEDLEPADAAKAGEGRTRAALYRALSLAYDFALAAPKNEKEYAELLEESGMKAQARAPMTPIAKLVFGIDYDKARLTEFAAALSYALRQGIAAGGFQNLIEKQSGGLKALVAAERQARRPEPKPDAKAEVARARLRVAPPISLADLPAEEEFALVLTRRGADGHHEPVAIVDDEALIERVIRRAG